MKRISPQFLLALVSALFALTAYWLFATEAGLGGSDWAIQPNAAAWPARLWLFPVATLAVFGGLAGWFSYRRCTLAANSPAAQRATGMAPTGMAPTGLALASLCLLGLLWPWALFGPSKAGGDRLTTLVSLTWSDVTTPFFELAYSIDNPRLFAAQYADRNQTPASRYSARVATHPPGTTLFYYAARRSYERWPPLQSVGSALTVRFSGSTEAGVAERSRLIVQAATGHRPALPKSAVGAALWCAFLLALAAMATVPAVYLLGAGTGAGRNEPRGLLAAALFVLAPSVGLGALGSDILVTLGAAWTFVLLMHALQPPNSRSAQPLLAAGAVVALTSFISFGALAIGLIVALAAGLHFWPAPSAAPSAAPLLRAPGARLRAFAATVLLFGAGFLATWLLLKLLFPMEPLRIYRQAMAAHHFAAVENRDYLNWLVMNPIVLAVFAGWPVSLPVVLPLVLRSAFQLPAESGVLIGRAALLTAGFLSVSGKVRGEVERLWMFLLPAVCVLAAYTLLAILYPPPPAAQSSTSGASNGGPCEIAPPAPPNPRARWAVCILVALLLLQALQSLFSATALTPMAHL